MKRVGVRELKEQGSRLLSGREPFAVERYGQVIGFYIPVEPERDRVQQALDRLGGTVDRILAEHGITENDLEAALGEDSQPPADGRRANGRSR